MRRYQVISADGHLEVPPDGWLRHVPSAHRDLAPRLVKLRDGGEAWVVEGLPMIHNGQNLSAGRTVKLKGVSYWNADGSFMVEEYNHVRPDTYSYRRATRGEGSHQFSEFIRFPR